MARTGTDADHDGEGRPRLTRSRILDAALRVADAEGLDGLTMRRLAAELGVAPMALYSHFRSKEELLVGLVDRAAGEIDLPAHEGGDWKRELRSLARAIRNTLLDHPALVRLVAGSQPLTPNVLALYEGTLSLLRRSGFDDESAAHAFYPVFVYTIGFVAQEVARFPGGRMTAEEQAEAERQVRAQLESLPRDRYPVTVDLAPYLARCADDEFFDYGLDRLLLGIEAHVRGGPAFVRGT